MKKNLFGGELNPGHPREVLTGGYTNHYTSTTSPLQLLFLAYLG